VRRLRQPENVQTCIRHAVGGCRFFSAQITPAYYFRLPSGCRMVLQKQGKNLQNGIVLATFFDTIQFYLAANIRFSIFD
jgi:hypothetical protein